MKVKSKGNRYQEKIRNILQEFITEYNIRYPNQRMKLVTTYGKDTPERPADFIIMQNYNGYEYPFLYVECKHVKKATKSMKKQWWDHLNRPNGIIIYKEHSRKDDMVIFDKHLGERPLEEWLKMFLEGK